jgi:hypothetical protein
VFPYCAAQRGRGLGLISQASRVRLSGPQPARFLVQAESVASRSLADHRLDKAGRRSSILLWPTGWRPTREAHTQLNGRAIPSQGIGAVRIRQPERAFQLRTSDASPVPMLRKVNSPGASVGWKPTEAARPGVRLLRFPRMDRADDGEQTGATARSVKSQWWDAGLENRRARERQMFDSSSLRGRLEAESTVAWSVPAKDCALEAASCSTHAASSGSTLIGSYSHGDGRASKTLARRFDSSTTREDEGQQTGCTKRDARVGTGFPGTLIRRPARFDSELAHAQVAEWQTHQLEVLAANNLAGSSPALCTKLRVNRVIPTRRTAGAVWYPRSGDVRR